MTWLSFAQRVDVLADLGRVLAQPVNDYTAEPQIEAIQVAGAFLDGPAEFFGSYGDTHATAAVRTDAVSTEVRRLADRLRTHTWPDGPAGAAAAEMLRHSSHRLQRLAESLDRTAGLFHAAHADMEHARAIWEPARRSLRALLDRLPGPTGAPMDPSAAARLDAIRIAAGDHVASQRIAMELCAHAAVVADRDLRAATAELDAFEAAVASSAPRGSAV